MKRDQACKHYAIFCLIIAMYRACAPPVTYVHSPSLSTDIRWSVVRYLAQRLWGTLIIHVDTTEAQPVSLFCSDIKASHHRRTDAIPQWVFGCTWVENIFGWHLGHCGRLSPYPRFPLDQLYCAVPKFWALHPLLLVSRIIICSLALTLPPNGLFDGCLLARCLYFVIYASQGLKFILVCNCFILTDD